MIAVTLNKVLYRGTLYGTWEFNHVKSGDKRVIRGKQDVLSVFLEIETALRQYLKRFLVRKQDIEDIVQETFIRSYNAEKRQEIQSHRTFLFKVAKNLALSELARKSNRLATYMEDSALSEVLDDRADVEENVSRQEELHLYINAMRSLPAQCQKVFVMCKVYGFSHKEIASELNISVSTVEKHLVKGLKRCHKYMQENNIDMDGFMRDGKTAKQQAHR